MRVLNKWMIRRVQVVHDGMFAHGKERYQLLRNESEVVAEFDITEIREVKKIFEGWLDPYSISDREKWAKEHPDEQYPYDRKPL